MKKKHGWAEKQMERKVVTDEIEEKQSYKLESYCKRPKTTLKLFKHQWSSKSFLLTDKKFKRECKRCTDNKAIMISAFEFSFILTLLENGIYKEGLNI